MLHLTLYVFMLRKRLSQLELHHGSVHLTRDVHCSCPVARALEYGALSLTGCRYVLGAWQALKGRRREAIAVR